MSRLVATRMALAAAAAVALAAGGAHAQPKVTVAIFAPNAPFESGEARYSFASRLAQQLQSVAGVTAEPKAYARSTDFEAAVKKGQVDLAVVDAVYLAERGVPWSVVAIATSGGETAARWSLFSSEPGGVLDLKGKRLALAATGPRDAQFIDNALGDGELGKHFGARSAAPDVASAVAAVTLKKAECVFAPDAAGKGLRRVFDAGRLPNPALVAVRALPGELADKVKRAVLAHAASGPYDGWRAGAADPYRALGGRLAPRVRRPVMAEPQLVPLDESDALLPAALDPALLDLRDQFWRPTETP